MKFLKTSAIALCFIALGAAAALAGDITVDEAVMAKSIDKFAPIEASHKFSSEIGKIYCYTKVSGAELGDSIKHVWYHNEKKVFEIALNIKGSPYRTYSNKTITADSKGAWRVDIINKKGKTIKSINFTIE